MMFKNDAVYSAVPRPPDMDFKTFSVLQANDTRGDTARRIP